MKQITVIIKPFKLDEVRKSLADVEMTGPTAIEVKDFGRQRGHTELYRSAEHVVGFLPKIKIEVVVAESQVESVTDTIVRAARTGRIGNDKILVIPVEWMIRIRTGKKDEATV